MEGYFVLRYTESVNPLQRRILDGPIDRQSQKLRCESSSEEHGAGNPHAMFCGGWQRVTAEK
jgi:hypothetical protein